MLFTSLTERDAFLLWSCLFLPPLSFPLNLLPGFTNQTESVKSISSRNWLLPQRRVDFGVYGGRCYWFIKLELPGLSPRAKLVLTSADRSCHVVSVTDPYGCILGFLDRSRYHSFQVAP
jgi:hypothetical protein